MTALSSCDAWAVGNYFNDVMENNGQTLIEHWNGSSWKHVPSPSPGGRSKNNTLLGVTAVSRTDAWAVGNYVTVTGGSNLALIEHWDGTAWKQVPSPSPSGATVLNGVAAASATDAWAVGQYFTSTTVNPLVLQWDGQQWTQKAVPAPGSGSVLEAVAATSAKDAWAVGAFNTSGGQEKTLIERWNGTKWVQVPSPNPAGPVGEIVLGGVVATSASNAWAVGTYSTGTTDKTLIEHWNGHAWTLVASPNPAPRNSLLAVAATSAGNVWAVGTRTTSTTQLTLIVRWNGTKWVQVPSPSPGQQVNELAGVATTSATDVWAVGDFTTGGVTQVLAAHCC